MFQRPAPTTDARETDDASALKTVAGGLFDITEQAKLQLLQTNPIICAHADKRRSAHSHGVVSGG